MQVQLVSIGNSKGVRIPATLLRQYGMDTMVELLPERDQITIRPIAAKPRQGWEDAFKVMAERGDDTLLIDESIDPGDWEWS